MALALNTLICFVGYVGLAGLGSLCRARAGFSAVVVNIRLRVVVGQRKRTKNIQAEWE